MAEIEQLQISLKEFFRDFVVQLLTGVMAFLQKPSHRHRDRLLRCRQKRKRRNTPVTVGKMTSSAKKRVSHLGRFHGKTQDDENKIDTQVEMRQSTTGNIQIFVKTLAFSCSRPSFHSMQ